MGEREIARTARDDRRSTLSRERVPEAVGPPGRMAYKEGRAERDVHADARWRGVLQQAPLRPIESEVQLSSLARNGFGGKGTPRNTDEVNAIRNGFVREAVIGDPRERPVNRLLVPERGILERERSTERPWMMDRHALEEREPEDIDPLGTMVDLAGRVLDKDVHKHLLHVLGRGEGPTQESTGFGGRQREGERAHNSVPPTARSSQNLLPLSGTPPTPRNGVEPLTGGQFEARLPPGSNFRNFDGVSSQGSSTYNSFVPVRSASGLPFQEGEHFQGRSRSPTQFSHQSAHQQIPPLVSSRLENQHLHRQLQHEQSSHLRERYPMEMFAQLHQAQEFPQQQPESQLGQLQAQLQHPVHQQLVQHQKFQQTQQLNPFNTGQKVQQPRSSPPLNSVILAWAPSAGSVQSYANQNPNISPGFVQSGLLSVQSSENHNLNFPTESFESRLIPPIQSAQSLPQFQEAVASRVMTTSLQPTLTQLGFQRQYPSSPSRPPPVQFANTIGTPASAQVGVRSQMNSVVGTAINQMTNFREQPQRYSQPPLPPGLPLASTTSTASEVGFFTYMLFLLNLLVPHGVSKPSPPATSSSAPVVGAEQRTPNASFVPIPATAISMLLGGFSQTVVIPETRTVTTDLQGGPHSTGKSETESIGVDFVQELLRKRHEHVVDALYSDLPIQCMTCGLRFKAREEHRKHMDWHVSKKRMQKSQKRVSRNWFVSEESYNYPSRTSSAAPSCPSILFENTELATALPAEENLLSGCALCGEQFEYFYSDEADDWMCKGVVYLSNRQGMIRKEGLDSTARGPIVHIKCTAVDSIDGVQPEIQAHVANSVRMEVHRTRDRVGEDKILPFLTDNFGSSEMKEEQEDLGSKRKRARY